MARTDPWLEWFGTITGATIGATIVLAATGSGSITGGSFIVGGLFGTLITVVRLP